MHKVMALYDTDSSYAVRFMQYAARRRLIPFDIQVFTMEDELRKFMEAGRAEILLTADKKTESAAGEDCLVIFLSENIGMAGEKAERQAADKRKYVSGTDNAAVKKDTGENKSVRISSIYKYQPVSEIMREVMDIYGREKRTGRVSRGESPAKTKTGVIGIYSPVGRCLKTSFALALGLILAKDRPVLYLNFEAFSGFEKLLHTKFSHDISDVLYFIKTGRDGSSEKIKDVVCNMGELAFIPPAAGGSLSRISEDEWETLLSDVRGLGRYENIIVDFAAVPDTYPELLGLCDAVYMPVLPDKFSREKIAEFEALWNEETPPGKEKIRKLYLEDIKMPESYDRWPLMLPYSELGAAAASVIKHDGL